MQESKKRELMLAAAKIRRWSLEEVYAAQSGHIGGSLSLADFLAVLYWQEMNIDPKTPQNPDRDRFVLSKGHCSPAVYAALSLRGYFPTEELRTFRDIDSNLSGHVEMRHVKGVDMSAGSLGQGLSAAVGMALAARMDKKTYRVYCAVGDGEIQEGQIWEACMFASHHKLSNLCLFLDNNNLQISGSVDQVVSLKPIPEKFEAFGFNTIKLNGHSIEELEAGFAEARGVTDRPSVLIAQTVKGRGVDFMENNYAWHGSPPNREQYESAAAQLDDAIARLEREEA
jgi:transketolase